MTAATVHRACLKRAGPIRCASCLCRPRRYEDVWSQLFKSMGRTYDDPKLVLYSDRVSSACGLASAASGPFYCPEDQKAYLDLSFFQERIGSTRPVSSPKPM